MADAVWEDTVASSLPPVSPVGPGPELPHACARGSMAIAAAPAPPPVAPRGTLPAQPLDAAVPELLRVALPSLGLALPPRVFWRLSWRAPSPPPAAGCGMGASASILTVLLARGGFLLASCFCALSCAGGGGASQRVFLVTVGVRGFAGGLAGACCVAGALPAGQAGADAARRPLSASRS